jgi:restriction endonuclease Mrr
MIGQIFLVWWTFWYIWVIALVIIILKLITIWISRLFKKWRIRRKFIKGEKWRSDNELLYWLRGLKPWEFEEYIANLFTRLGYKAEAVGKSHDGGIDVVIEKDGVKSYIQCKKFITRKVSVHDVRDFLGALDDHLARGKAYFITTNKFTLEAEKFAEDKPIELIDGFKLIEYIKLSEKQVK